jgi:hypothetical protein
MIKKMTYCLVLALAVAGCEKTTVEGPNGKALKLTKPSDTTIIRGDTAKVAVVVARTNFTGPVTANFNNLPNGVSVVDAGGTIEGTERTFVLKASDTADMVGNHAAKISVSGPDGMTATEEFEITVKEKT